MRLISNPTIELNKEEQDIIEKAILLFDCITNRATYGEGGGFDRIADEAANISGYLADFYDNRCVEENS